MNSGCLDVLKKAADVYSDDSVGPNQDSRIGEVQAKEIVARLYVMTLYARGLAGNSKIYNPYYIISILLWYKYAL